ncbi:MAG: hypothetical protein CVU45_05180, partial [Chloroflexi bacterium HGW-Chloroflexi-7]
MNPTYEIELTASSFGGDCIGKLPDGKTIFIPFGIAGECVEVEIVDSKKNFARGRIKRVLRESEKRIKARCPHFM